MSQESLLPRPIVRGRNSDVKMKEVRMLLTLMDERDSLAGLGNNSMTQILRALLNHTDTITCKYVRTWTV